MTNPSIGIVCDHFDQGAVNPAMWTVPSGMTAGTVTTATVSTTFMPSPRFGGFGVATNAVIPALECAGGDTVGDVGIISVGSYDLTNSGISFELASWATTGSASWQGYFQLSNSSNSIYWNFEENQVYAAWGLGNVLAGTVSPEFQFLRIRESDGTVYFDNSPDSVNWVNVTNFSDPFDITDFNICIKASGGGAGTATLAIANLNYVLAD